MTLCIAAPVWLGSPLMAQTEASTPSQQACLAGDKLACNNWGSELEHGLGVTMDKAKAREAYLMGCEMGEVFSCSNVGLLMQDGRGGPVDPQGAMEWLERGCDGGDPKGCFWVGKLHRDVPALANPERAVAYEKRGCKLDYAPSCVWLGIAQEDGIGHPKDLSASVVSYMRACDLRSGIGCYNAALVLKHRSGSALGEDRFMRSVKLARRGCGLSHTNSCDALAFALSIGRGVGKDEARARALYEDTCAQESKLGCRNLALMLKAGQGGPKDLSRAADLMQRACALGNAKAC